MNTRNRVCTAIPGLLLSLFLAAKPANPGLPDMDMVLVNDDAAGGAWQTSPRFGMDQDLRIHMVWEEGREGDINIYTQKLNAQGAPLNNAARLNDDPGFADQRNPVIAVHPSGTSLTVWEDWRGGGQDVYFQITDPSGRLLSRNQRIGDEGTGGAVFRSPSVTVTPDTVFFVSWSDNTDGAYEIRIRGIRTGGEMTPVYTVSQDAADDEHDNPAVIAWSTDTLIVAWQACTGEDCDVLARTVPVYPDFDTEPAVRIADGMFPAVAAGADQRLALAWLSGSGTDRTLNCRISDSGLQPPEPALQQAVVCPDLQLYGYSLFSVQGSFGMLWQTHEAYAALWVRTFDPTGWTGEAVRLLVSDRAGDQVLPFALSGSGTVYFCFEDYAQRDADALLGRFAPGNPEAAELSWISEDVGAADQQTPQVAVSTGGRWIAVWEDLREGYVDIYAQCYHAVSNPSGNNTRINTDTGSRHHRFPDVSMNRPGESVVAWRSESETGTYIYAQRLNPSGSLSGDPVRISDSACISSENAPCVAMDDDGSYLVIWRVQDNAYDLMYQFVDTNNVKIGSNRRLNDDAGGAVQKSPDAASDGNGHFVAVWEDNRLGAEDVYAQLFAGHEPAGVNLPVHGHTELYQGEPSVSMNSGGNFVIAWRDNRNYIARIYYRRYGSDGTPVSTEIMIDAAASAVQKTPRISLTDQGMIAIAWLDYATGGYSPVLNMERRDALDALMENPWALGNSYVAHADVAASDEAIVLVWQDNGRHRGWDVMAGLTDLSPVAVHERPADTAGPGAIRVFPNPANPGTAVRIQVPGRDGARLRLFNLQGQCLRSWSFGSRSGEDIRLVWDGCDNTGRHLPAGIYMLRFETSSSSFLHKICILK
ncbi:T9SS type A sorting domain-containing protein [bacterium]|nr:T9SS type A sorting domain-containing protein [bacterium]